MANLNEETDAEINSWIANHERKGLTESPYIGNCLKSERFTKPRQ